MSIFMGCEASSPTVRPAPFFREKEGRRHAHVVWSRIDTENMKAINLPFYKTKLRDLPRELFVEHGWNIRFTLKPTALACLF